MEGRVDSLSSRNAYHPKAPWPCMRGNNQGTGVPSRPLLLGKSEAEREVWHFSTGNGVFSTPIIGPGEMLYVGSGDGFFYALDPLERRERWRFQTGGVIDGAAALAADGSVYFASCDASMYALDARGKQRWRLDLLKDRKHFTPSTIYWWEANVGLGPNGLLYAGCDDFYLYAVDPDSGQIRWAALTGMNIWTAPAFSHDGTLVYVVSFDTCAYAFEAETGKQRWKTKTGNLVASTAAIGPDGTVYFGSFDGHLYALDGQNGEVKWRFKTAGAIYASPTVAPNGMVYVGSADGLLYAICPRTQKSVWTFYTGDVIRGSAALGPDPEGKSSGLIYFGSGNGHVYALDRKGRRRWSYQTYSSREQVEYANINASVALGDHGLATASAGGDIIWIPYDHYLRPGASGITREEGDSFPDRGVRWYLMSPGGTPARDPLAPEGSALKDVLTLPAGQPIGLRVVARENGQTLPPRVDPNSVDVRIEPRIPIRVSVQPEGNQINVIPQELPATDALYTLTARARVKAGTRTHTVQGSLRYRALRPQGVPAIEALAERPFSITHMSVYSPSIVPSFDQMGIACQVIDVRIVSADAGSGKVVGWGIEKFGLTDTGETVGVPVPRHLYFPFEGMYRDGQLVLTSRRCRYELTAFPVPLSLLSFAACVDEQGVPSLSGSLLAETERYRPGKGDPLGSRYEVRHPAQLGWALARALSSSWRGLQRAGAYVRKWFPETFRLRDVPQVLRAMCLTLPVLVRTMRKETMEPWGLFDAQGRFSGMGTFKASALPPERLAVTEGIELVSLAYLPNKRRVEARFSCRGRSELERTVVPGLLLVDEAGCRPVFLDYNARTTIQREESSGALLGCQLTIPLNVPLGQGPYRVVALLDARVVGECRVS